MLTVYFYVNFFRVTKKLFPLDPVGFNIFTSTPCDIFNSQSSLVNKYTALQKEPANLL